MELGLTIVLNVCALWIFLWGKQIVKTESKERMPLIAIYCYSVLFAANGTNVCIM